MKKIFICFVVTVCSFMLNSCAAPAINNEPMRFNTHISQTGIILGSVTFPNEQSRFGWYYPRITALDSTNLKSSTEIEMQYNVWNTKHDGQLNGGKTYLFAIERKPGKYNINHIRLGSKNGLSNFEIPFEVNKGEITYVGEIFFDEYALKNDTLLKLNDKYLRDVAGIAIHQPRVNWRLAKRSDLIINNKDIKVDR